MDQDVSSAERANLIDLGVGGGERTVVQIESDGSHPVVVVIGG